MLEKLGFCAICFVGMIVGEILAHKVDSWFASRTREGNGGVNNLKSKIDGN